MGYWIYLQIYTYLQVPVRPNIVGWLLDCLRIVFVKVPSIFLREPDHILAE